eukprot:3395960-Pleurochrysis_carterae.AAC.2
MKAASRRQRSRLQLDYSTSTLATHFVSGQQISIVPETFIAEASKLIHMIQAHLDNQDEEG